MDIGDAHVLRVGHARGVCGHGDTGIFFEHLRAQRSITVCPCVGGEDDIRELAYEVRMAVGKGLRGEIGRDHEVIADGVVDRREEARIRAMRRIVQRWFADGRCVDASGQQRGYRLRVGNVQLDKLVLKMRACNGCT